MSNADYKALGLGPVSGDNPAGEDIQFDGDFEAIRLEIGKLDSVTGEQVNWSEVIDKGAGLLGQKSKHLQVAAYLTLALFEKNGYSGLADGLQVCRDLLNTFWETMYPPLKRKRGRIEAISWLAERGGKTAARLTAGNGDLETVKSCCAAMTGIEAFLSEKLGDEAPGLGDLRRDLETKARDIEHRLREAEAKKAAKAAAAAAGAPEIASLDEANKALGMLRQNARNIAEYFRKTKSEDPFSYRLARAVNFSSIVMAPPNKGGQTQIPAPATELMARIEEALGKKDYSSVIEAGETAFAASPFWLDAHRHVLTAMEAAGEQYSAARTAIAEELALFIRRLPEISSCAFANGTPFASPETVQLLQELAAAAGQETRASGTGEDGDDRLAETAGAAQKLAGRGKLAEAVEMLQDGIAQTGDRRGQFLWRLELARICLGAGKMNLAVPQLEFLCDQIEEYHLEQWEPQLSREVFSTLYLAQQRLAKVARNLAPELTEKMRLLHARLCRLDPAAALKIDGNA